MDKNRNGLIQYLKKNGQMKPWAFLAERFGFCSGNAARNTWRRYKMSNGLIESKGIYPQLESFANEYEANINKEHGTSNVKWISTKEVLTEAEIYTECKMDPTKWIMTNIWHKKRGLGFVYSANFKLIPINIQQEKNKSIAEFLHHYKNIYNKLSKNDILQNSNFSDPCCLLISLTDSHLDMLDFKETSLDERILEYKKVLDQLVYKAYQSNYIEEIVYVIGNDMFNTDNFLNMTTQLTQQYPNSQWDVAYEKIFNMQVACIQKLKQFCNRLHVLTVTGNHDRTKAFYLTHALEVYFHSDSTIVFDKTSEPTKVYTYGATALFFHHGDDKMEKLPLYMASKYAKQWGSTRYHEVGVGDKHHKKSWSMKIGIDGEEIDGVRIFMTPALCGPNQWSKGKLFDNAIQAGICRIYNKEKGYCGEFEERV